MSVWDFNESGSGPDVFTIIKTTLYKAACRNEKVSTVRVKKTQDFERNSTVNFLKHEL
jgi:uncharacterized protein YwgA